MSPENTLIPFKQDPETLASQAWQEFSDRVEELGAKLHKMYDDSPVERKEYAKRVCQGGYNFGKTVGWVYEYSPNPEALESISQALASIAGWPNAGSVAWEMRRFIKFSSAEGNNIPDVVKFGNYLAKIGAGDPTNERGFTMGMDFFYWDSGWGVDLEASDEERLERQSQNVAGVISDLERIAYPEIIDARRLPSAEEIEAQERQEKEEYWKNFLEDARSFYHHPSFFDILNREEFINRPYHKILTYPVEIAEIAYGHWINRNYEDPSDAMSHYYRYMPHMVAQRSENWFPSPLPPDYVDFYGKKFEKRLKRTLEQKPWLIDFSVKWQDVLQRSFVGGNHQTNHAGEVELVFKNPEFDPSRDNRIFNREYEYRLLDLDEERLFFESVVNVESLEDSQPDLKPPDQPWVFNGQTGRPYLFKLADGREFNIFIKHEYGCSYWEGKLVIIASSGPGSLFSREQHELPSPANS